ncbi:MAG: hypothetical protein ACXVC0_09985 [Bdellovibrionota bacterium]
MAFEEVASKVIELAKTPAAASAITAVATLTGAYFGTVWRESRDYRRRQDSLRRMISAEIRLVLDLIRTNRYIEEVTRITAILEGGGIEAIRVKVNDFARIYHANLSDLGCLEGAADSVVTFYGYCQSAVTDLDQIMEICEGIFRRSPAGEFRFTEHERQQLLLMHQSLLAKLRQAVSTGQTALTHLLNQPVPTPTP